MRLNTIFFLVPV